jgi:hypothetical protein
VRIGRVVAGVVVALAVVACAGETTPVDDTPAASTPGSPSASGAAEPSATPRSTALPDGRHATYIKAVDTDRRTIDVDVVQWLTGAEADQAYYEETGDSSGVPNDYFIKNENTLMRTYEVGDSAEITVIWMEGEGASADLDPDPISFEELATYVADRPGTPPFWIELAGGVVQKIEEQYIP